MYFLNVQRGLEAYNIAASRQQIRSYNKLVYYIAAWHSQVAREQAERQEFFLPASQHDNSTHTVAPTK